MFQRRALHLVPFIPSRIADVPMQKLTQNGMFTMGSFYRFLNFSGLRCPYTKSIWKAPMPERVKVFLWPTSKNKLYAGEVLVKKRWNVTAGCSYVEPMLNQQVTYFLGALWQRGFGPHLNFSSIQEKDLQVFMIFGLLRDEITER